MTAIPTVHRAASSYFMPHYATARANFQKSVAETGGRLESLKLSAEGPNREPLTIDIGWFGAEHPRRVFIHSSGIHGVEAFAGSAIQAQWLDKGIPSIEPDDAIVLVHSLNPYGMAWLRRFNENNVDLNRNFREPGDYRAQTIAYWETINALLNPPSALTA